MLRGVSGSFRISESGFLERFFRGLSRTLSMSRSDTSKLVSTSGRGIVLRGSRSIGNWARTCLIGEMEGEDLDEQQVETGGEVVGKESSSNRIGQKGGRDQELLFVLQDILVMMIKLDCSWFI